VTHKKSQRINIGMRQAFALLLPYTKDRLMSQIKSVWLIILYLVFFQTFILKVKILEAYMIAIGIALVVLGLTLFLEELLLGPDYSAR